MYRIMMGLVLSGLLLASTPAAQSLDELVVSGDSLFELHRYSQSIPFYRDACRLDSNYYDAFWKLGRSLNLEGEIAPEDSQLAIFEAARDAEERAVELDESQADSHFQLARALGKIALFKGVFKSASLAKKVRKQARRAIEIDSLHDGAWHILGRWHREVGKKPKILRIPMGLGAANKEDAISFMRRAVELNPNYINHHLEMGITYLRYKDREAARAEFQKCLALPSQRPLDEKYKEEAEKYLAEMNEK
jgi:tetratricopeptide (TPR) repeat protein